MASKVVLITGANRGIGLSIAKALGQRAPQSTILVAGRSKQSAEKGVEELWQKVEGVNFRPVALDVTDDESINAAVELVGNEYGRLDVLVNNAGIASVPSPSFSDYRATFNNVFDTNVTSVGLLTGLFMHLLSRSQSPRVINISSGRASIHRLTSGALPPTASVPYSISKTAVNVLTLEMAKQYPDAKFYVANPGHCATGLNGFKGTKDPVEGARVVVELVVAEEGRFENGFWEFEEVGMREVPW